MRSTRHTQTVELGSSAVQYRTLNRKREPVFESLFGAVSKLAHFRSPHDAPINSAL